MEPKVIKTWSQNNSIKLIWTSRWPEYNIYKCDYWAWHFVIKKTIEDLYYVTVTHMNLSSELSDIYLTQDDYEWRTIWHYRSFDEADTAVRNFILNNL